MKIFEANEKLKKDINSFYKEQGYHSDWSKNERAFVAFDGDKLVGCVKVEKLGDISVLRGMYIDKCYQGNKLGTELIRFIEPLLNEYLSFCMPFSHLETFYQKIGFKQVSLDVFPDGLIKRFFDYEKAGYIIIPMQRNQISLS